MTWRETVLLTLGFSFCMASCAGLQRSPIVWEAKERSALGGRTYNGRHLEKLISVPLNPDNRSDGYFDLYYYLSLPPDWDFREKKTVLFVAGGPGRINRLAIDDENFATFLSKSEYQVVVFHLRGSGYSQIPPSNDFDRFLRTSYAVKDIEEIRRDLTRQKLLGPNGKWDAIIAWSYGTVLAQQYAHKYSDKVEKLVLLGPMSRHSFALLPDAEAEKAFDALNREVMDIQRNSLDQKLRLQPEFDDIEHDLEKQKLLQGILEQVFGGPGQEGILPRTENLFGNVQFVINHYCDIADTLEDRGLKYSQDFFGAITKIHMGSRFPMANDLSEPNAVGRVVIDELRNRSNVTEPKSSDSCLQPVELQDKLRNLYVIDTYDGINPRFLKNWFGGGKKDFRTALSGSVGTSGANPYIRKVGVADDVSEIRPWDPADYSHKVPTLILNGGADPVSGGSAAEQFFSKGLKGPRTLIDFPGVGHQFILPANTTPDWNGTVQLDISEIPPKKVKQIIGTVTGAKLNEKYKLTLESSNKTRYGDTVTVMGFGLLKDELLKGTNKAIGNVTALFKNTGNNDLQGGDSDWIINHALFTATVRFVLPTIKPGDTVQALGTIVGGTPRKQVELIGRSPNGNNNELEVPCYKILPGNIIQLWYVNTGDERAEFEDPRKWTISNGSSEQSFSVDKFTTGEPLKRGGLTTKTVKIPNMMLDPDDTVTLEDPDDSFDKKLVQACIPRAQAEPLKRQIILWNRHDAGWKIGTRTWVVKNDLYSLRVTVKPETDSDEVPGSRGFKEVNGNIEGVILAENRPSLVRPEDLKDKLDWQAINILENNQLAVLLENTSDANLPDTLRDWPYQERVEQEKTVNPCRGQKYQDVVRDCLIYSFLGMDKEDFQSRGLNSAIVKVLWDNFHGFPGNGDIRIACDRGEFNFNSSANGRTSTTGIVNNCR